MQYDFPEITGQPYIAIILVNGICKMLLQKNNLNIRSAVLVILLFGFSSLCNGGELPSNSLAWAENSGWINFGPTHQSVTIAADGLSGFAWAENTGWIKFGSDAGPPYANTNTADWGVNRDESGQLAGYAWGETIGWINFHPSHGSVVFDPASNTLTGFAWAENVGWIRLDNYDVIFSDGFEGL